MIHAGRTLDVENDDHTFRIYDGDELAEVASASASASASAKSIARFKVRKPEAARRIGVL